tara:strand:+ start:62 stop:349 length:288 start_codon:yes stop_codon:yes gene_type:complete
MALNDDIAPTLDMLKKENAELKEKLMYVEKSKKVASARIDAFVDEWYEENKDLVDIGEIKICGSYKVDLIPDELEKRIYSKMLKIVHSFLARDMI